MAQTKLISIRVDEDILKFINKTARLNGWHKRSFYVNRFLELGVALMQQGNENLISQFHYHRGDRIEIHDYDIIKGDWSNLKNE